MKYWQSYEYSAYFTMYFKISCENPARHAKIRACSFEQALKEINMKLFSLDNGNLNAYDLNYQAKTVGVILGDSRKSDVYPLA